MRCYKCNSVLSETDFCNSCGTDVTLYKKIVKMSNTYYNMGLAKARVRDLSGAADLLRRSVRIDKKNINARNLLGLVYYEMGEMVAAFSEWVISKNIKPEKNLADTYLKDVQTNLNRLNTMNQSIRKYNIALNAARQGSTDMAIIQLKKILGVNVNFLKAQQLLALLYMKKGNNDKALKILKKAIKIDVNNTITLKYIKEIEEQKAQKTSTDKKPPKTVKELNEREPLSGNDVIIPKSSYKDVNYGLITFINVVVGIVIGAAMVFFLVMPAKQKDMDSEYKETVNDYADQVAMLNISISELERQVESMEKEKNSLQTQVDEAVANKVDTTIYDQLLAAVGKYIAADTIGCAEALYEIDAAGITSDSMKSVYNSLKEATYEEAGEHYSTLAFTEYNSGNYEAAIPYFEKGVVFAPENVSLMYNFGKCYKAQNGGENNEKSIACFDKVIAMAPGTEYEGWAEYQKE